MGFVEIGGGIRCGSRRSRPRQRDASSFAQLRWDLLIMAVGYVQSAGERGVMGPGLRVLQRGTVGFAALAGSYNLRDRVKVARSPGWVMQCFEVGFARLCCLVGSARDMTYPTSTNC